MDRGKRVETDTVGFVNNEAPVLHVGRVLEQLAQDRLAHNHQIKRVQVRDQVRDGLDGRGLDSPGPYRVGIICLDFRFPLTADIGVGHQQCGADALDPLLTGEEHVTVDIAPRTALGRSCFGLLGTGHQFQRHGGLATARCAAQDPRGGVQSRLVVDMHVPATLALLHGLHDGRLVGVQWAGRS